MFGLEAQGLTLKVGPEKSSTQVFFCLANKHYINLRKPFKDIQSSHTFTDKEKRLFFKYSKLLSI
jgi:hypothetical protein